MYYLLTSPSPFLNPMLNVTVRAVVSSALLARHAIPGSGQPSFAKPRTFPLDLMQFPEAHDAAMDSVQRLDIQLLRPNYVAASD